MKTATKEMAVVMYKSGTPDSVIGIFDQCHSESKDKFKEYANHFIDYPGVVINRTNMKIVLPNNSVIYFYDLHDCDLPRIRGVNLSWVVVSEAASDRQMAIINGRVRK